MEWPLMRRARYDVERARWEAILSATTATCAAMQALFTAQTARYDALLEKYHALAAPKAEPTAPTFTSFPPVVAAALAKATASAPRDVRRAVYTKAQAMLDAGGTDADVASAVLRGESVEIAD